jgi:hypothetical protein
MLLLLLACKEEDGLPLSLPLAGGALPGGVGAATYGAAAAAAAVSDAGHVAAAVVCIDSATAAAGYGTLPGDCACSAVAADPAAWLVCAAGMCVLLLLLSCGALVSAVSGSSTCLACNKSKNAASDDPNQTLRGPE